MKSNVGLTVGETNYVSLIIMKSIHAYVSHDLLNFCFLWFILQVSVREPKEVMPESNAFPCTNRPSLGSAGTVLTIPVI